MIYVASLIKRNRATKDEIEARAQSSHALMQFIGGGDE